MVQPSDPSQPHEPSGEDAGQDNAFGFNQAEVPKNEKYNTQYLVSNMQKDARTTKLVIGGIIVAALLGLLSYLALAPAPEPIEAPSEQGLTDVPTGDAPTPAPSQAQPQGADSAPEAQPQ